MCPLQSYSPRRYYLYEAGKKVLHIDRDNFYGGEGAWVDLYQPLEAVQDKEEPNKELGRNRNWNIDLIPKYTSSMVEN